VSEPPEGAHAEALRRLGLSKSETRRLGAYLDLLAAWNPRVNLSGARSPEERVRVLVAAVLPALPLLEGAGPLIDVGSGNGSPGLVLALLGSQRASPRTTLLEPRAKRWAFLREAARVAELPAVEVLRQRHDAYRGPAAELLTLRALKLPLGELAPLVCEGGRVVVFGGAPQAAPPFLSEGAWGPTAAGIQLFRRQRST
jgi:16S rRNA (guanine527-N7)-methyltransferase